MLQGQDPSKSALADVTRYLQLLHRLSTTRYETLDALFTDYLAAGCDIFGLENGAILELSGGEAAVRSFRSALLDEREQEIPRRIATARKTVYLMRSGGPENPACIYTPIVVNDRLFGSIGFWSPRPAISVQQHPHAKQIIELMAQGIATAIDQRQLTEQLAYQAMHDSLTGLPNRLMLAERVTAALANARESGGMVAVAFIDLDTFKQINDTLGHEAGDTVLQEIAGRFAGCIEDGDTLARMGGDEFTAIFNDVASQTEAIEHAQRLLANLRKPCHVSDHELFVSASIGISFFPIDGEDAATLLRNADAAMYSAKYAGKNQVHCYRSVVTATARERLRLETHLHRALERDELRMYFQPQVLRDRQLAGVEVLLGWAHPELGRISPSQFIPIAEDTGIILQIGSWVIHEACRTMAKWRRELGTSASLAVNVSAIQFAQPTLVDTVASALSDSGLPASSLELELTESAVMRDIAQSTATMCEFRALGAKIAIDDFGTGYSSLSYLKRLPADILKIDQSFLTGIEGEASAFALVNAVAVLGHAFNMLVAAEGVETPGQFELVRKAGCDRAQGHLFGEPLSAADMEDLLRKNQVHALCL